jgi:hypothetical protein
MFLRRILGHALSGSMLSSLALACTGTIGTLPAESAQPAEKSAQPAEKSAHPATPDPVARDVAVRCAGGMPLLAPGFNLTHPVDYVADCSPTGTQLSSAGEICASAERRAECEAAVRVPVTSTRHLLTTDGDAVAIWSGGAALALLQPIDTPAEAVWLLAAAGYTVACGTPVVPIVGDPEVMFEVMGATRATCTGGSQMVTIEVLASGSVVERPVRAPCPPPEPVPGRGPEGLTSIPGP